MGIQGLHGFVSAKPNLLDKFFLRDTKLIIDGLGLLRQLHGGLDSQFGGEYAGYRYNCELFFDNLQQCDITPYVVFDGAWDLDGKKYATYIDRHQNKLNTAQAVAEGSRRRSSLIPVFALSILQNVARKREDVFVVTADFEADEEIAALANTFECPVLAADSDFFIYPLLKGYIHFDQLNWKSIDTQVRRQEGSKRQRSAYLSCFIFTPSNQEALCQYLGIEKKKLSLLATIRGNDYLKADTLRRFHDSIQLPRGGNALNILGEWLKKRKSKKDEAIVDEILDILRVSGNERKEVETAAKQSIKTYSINFKSQLFKDCEGSSTLQKTDSSAEASTSDDKTPPQDSSSTSSPSSITPGVFGKLGLPSHVIQSLRKGYLHSMWINVFLKGELISLKQVEDFSQCSANDISKDIRAVIYGVLLQDKFAVVKEYDRESTSSEASQKEVVVPKTLENYGELPALEKVGELPGEQLKLLVLAALGLDSKSVSQFKEDHQLPMAVTRYWYQKSKVQECIARGLITGFLLDSDEDPDPFPAPSRDVLHAYAQWQSCLIYANDLNVVLNSPFPEFDITNFFSGRKTHELAEGFKRNSEAFSKTLDDLPLVKKNYLRMWGYIEGK